MPSRKEYHQTLPKKRMASGMIFQDKAGKVLIVEPVYKTEWEIPGGVTEEGESPLTTAIREVLEELSLVVDREQCVLLSVDYLYETENRTEALQFVFRGPELTEQQIASITLAQDELKGFAFVPLDQAAELLGPVVGERLLRALSASALRYWEDGEVGNHNRHSDANPLRSLAPVL